MGEGDKPKWEIKPRSKEGGVQKCDNSMIFFLGPPKTKKKFIFFLKIQQEWRFLVI